MEDAYSELYQQFLRLRSLCLRQASLLHRLTTALQKQQGVSVSEVEVSDLISIPVQCSHEVSAFLYEKPQPLTSAGPDPTLPHGAEHASRNVGCASGVLAEGMSKLSVNMPCQRKQDAKTEMLNPFVFNTEFSKLHADSPSRSKPSEQNGPGERRAPYMMPMTDGGLLNLSGGAMMSEVAMHSHVCDFCQAVFPGDSTTRGEFLRHLHTHVT
ncbi:uncharacterized protein LOC106939184 [Poecilia latipinna]|uniref:Uncharacterized LOC106939184 n=1 Tax=Poecilia latipinna TaxID=48699 RepID=A0A3B3U3T7_9TELE|nr:PREDICTED: uncharacterized protein LOC106939184 [Poecilia latipinna]XP_014876982.1 PREDICTED: uncharacterized protein LOC106939184 [Poecilia latipinna]XP_014876983.1 PREDICTED: uncharacterized protein LOC106939184 [Poecilia latipinna]